MITDAIISLPLAVLNFLIGLLPDYTGFPSGMDAAINYILDFTLQLGDILPTTQIWNIILATLSIEIIIQAFNTIAWLLHWKQPNS